MNNSCEYNVCEKNLYTKIYEILPTTYLKFISDSQSGTMDSYFSRSIVKEDNDDSLQCLCIYNLSKQYLDVFNPTEPKTNRMRKLEKGYYNLHHFGEPIIFYNKDNNYYFIGRVNDCNVAIWSFFIKWLLTFKVGIDRVHLKSTAVYCNGKCTLLIGDKGAGKSSLVYELSKRNKELMMISNTHILIDEKLSVQGLYSSMNFRNSMAQRIRDENDALKDMVVKGCTNIDPDVLNYRRALIGKVKKIIFYQHNNHGECIIKQIKSLDLLKLIYAYSYGINFYSLQSDLMEYCNGNLQRVMEKLNKDDMILKNLVECTENYIVDFDVYTADGWNKLKKLF